MLRKGSIFKELYLLTENKEEKKLIDDLQQSLDQFYMFLDLYNECSIYSNLYQSLFVEEEVLSIEMIAERNYVHEKMVKRFKTKTERLVILVIYHINPYRRLKKIMAKTKKVEY